MQLRTKLLYSLALLIGLASPVVVLEVALLPGMGMFMGSYAILILELIWGD